MASTSEFRRAFVRRLNQACDLSPLVPEPNKGRQTYLATKLDIATESVSKWFKGVSMPRPETMTELSKLLDVDQSWLAFGIQPEIPHSERKVHAERSDGAVQLVWGLITLAGGHCGVPSKNDTRSTYIDFYATLRGTIFPVYVALAREISRDHYDVILPKEFAELRSIAVIPLAPGRYHCLDMLAPLVDVHKIRKGGSIIVHVNRVDQRKYQTGRDAWPTLRFDGLGN